MVIGGAIVATAMIAYSMGLANRPIVNSMPPSAPPPVPSKETAQPAIPSTPKPPPPRAGLTLQQALSKGYEAGAVVDLNEIVAASYFGIKRFDELFAARDDIGVEQMRRNRQVLYPSEYVGRARIIRVIWEGRSTAYCELRLIDDESEAIVWVSTFVIRENR